MAAQLYKVVRRTPYGSAPGWTQVSIETGISGGRLVASERCKFHMDSTPPPAGDWYAYTKDV